MSEPTAEPAPEPAVPAMAQPVLVRPATRLATAAGSTMAAVVFALLLGSTQSLTAPAALLMLVAGYTAWVLWFSAPVRASARWPAGRCPGVSIWVLFGAAFGVVELAAYVVGDDYDNPTFSRVVDPLLTSPVTRTVVGLGWILWGRHLAGLVPRASEETVDGQVAG